jgi:hypothetical protein
VSDVITGFLFVKIPPQVPKYYVTMEYPTTISLVRNSLILVLEEVQHKAGFLGDLKGSK